MIDWKLRQSQQVEKERRPYIESCTLEQFRSKAKEYPAGSVYHWALGAVYGPPSDKRKSA